MKGNRKIAALKIVLGIKHFIIYLVYAILFALFSGLLIDKEKIQICDMQNMLGGECIEIKPNEECASICGLFCGACPSFPNECHGCFSDFVRDACKNCSKHRFLVSKFVA